MSKLNISSKLSKIILVVVILAAAGLFWVISQPNQSTATNEAEAAPNPAAVEEINQQLEEDGAELNKELKQLDEL